MLNTQLPSQEAPDMDSAPTSIITSVGNPPLPCYSPPPATPSYTLPPPNLFPWKQKLILCVPPPTPRGLGRPAVQSYLTYPQPCPGVLKTPTGRDSCEANAVSP